MNYVSFLMRRHVQRTECDRSGQNARLQSLRMTAAVAKHTVCVLHNVIDEFEGILRIGLCFS